MIHHYNYTSTLSQILSYHQQLEEQNGNNETNDHSTSSSTICDDPKLQVESSRGSTATTNNNNNNNNNNKSFTIEAILGLKSGDAVDANHHDRSPDSNGSVVNLSVHHHLHHNHHQQQQQQHDLQQQSDSTTDNSRPLVSGVVGRLQLPPVRHHSSSSVAVTGHYTVGHGCAPPGRHNVRNLKHLPSAIPNGKKSCKSKRVRTIFTPEQLERLEAEFERQQYMVGPERLYLAHTLQLTEAQVKVWFQNRRIKWRKHHLELTHQRLAALKQQQLLLDDTSHPDVQDNNSSSTDT